MVETRDPPVRRELGVGQTASVTPPAAHHVANPGTTPCRFLLVQGVGQYDFIRED